MSERAREIVDGWLEMQREGWRQHHCQHGTTCVESFNIAGVDAIDRGNLIAAVDAALTAEREAREQAERELEQQTEHYDYALARLEAVESALRLLLAELSDVQLEAVREGCGNTNAAVLSLRVVEARAALHAPRPEPAGDPIRAALEAYHFHMGGCAECDKIVCEEGDDLWFAVNRAADPDRHPARPEGERG